MIQTFPNIIGAPMGLPIGIPSMAANSLRERHEKLSTKRGISYVADYGGCAFYRILAPDMFLNLYQKAEIIDLMVMIFDPRFYSSEIQCVKIQRQVTPAQLEFARLLKKFSLQFGFKFNYEIDDVIFYEDIPLYNKNRDQFANDVIRNSIIEILGLVDEITVTTPYFRDYIIHKTGYKNVTAIPNYLPRWWFDRYYNLGKLVKEFEKNKKRPVISIFAGGTHADLLNRTNYKDDFESVVDVIIKTRKDFRWQFYGAYPFAVLPYVRTGEIKVHNWVPIVDYPRAMAESGTQVCFAALQPNEFNFCKSNIKLLEASAMGYPCVCPDMVTYKDSWLKYRTGDEFVDVLKTITKNQTVYAEQCKKAREFVESYWLEDEVNLMKHWEANFTAFNSPQRKFLTSTN